ncbi:FecR family protein [Filimonas effusa]|uniref:FecR family protein n=1 Tax=Filimonas effusa TaxID=2508721 RepID=A0A4Q1CZZ3_9BACT|nr:FecR family protein [Filimonas effusa]RXK80896.1 FecR family protein [Filimonas effusa]
MKPDLNEKWDDLLVKYLLGEATPNEQQEVAQWRSLGEANESYYQQLSAVWEKSRVIAAKTTVSEEEAWMRFRQRVKNDGFSSLPQAGNTNDEEGGGKVVKHSRFTFQWWQAAAAFLVLLAGAWLTVTLVNNRGTVTIASGNSVLTDTLPDGSVITLNKNAAIVYKKSFNDSHRNIDLKGEAFFDVASDKNKPFTIKTGDNIAITVLGTSFNVNNTDTVTEIIVESGMVEVAVGERTVRLHRHEKLTVSGKEMQLYKQSNNSVLYNHYRTHTFVCASTPLRELVFKLNEVYAADIVIGNNRIADLPLTTTFQEASLDSIIHIVCLTLDISSRKEKNRIILE